MNRIIPFEQAANVRDLGGYLAADGRRVRYGLIYRGIKLDNIQTEGDVQLLKELKLKAVLDLRSRGECELNPDPVPEGAELFCVCAMHYPNGDEIDFSPEGMKRLHSEADNLIPVFGYRPTTDEMFTYLYTGMPFGNPGFQKLFELLEGGCTPLLFHCTAGKDRTGIGAILVLLALGVSREQALEDYMMTNQCIQRDVERLLAENAEDPAAQEDILRRMLVRLNNASETLDAIEKRYESYDQYFEAEFGLDKERIDRLRAMYLE
jgi:protein-tyrosine phosphatase